MAFEKNRICCLSNWQQAGTNISGLTTDWQTLSVSITNDNDTYSRVIRLGDNEIGSDYISTFPVLWGTTSNSTGQSIYFDDLSIKTTKNEEPVEPDKITLS